MPKKPASANAKSRTKADVKDAKKVDAKKSVAKKASKTAGRKSKSRFRSDSESSPVALIVLGMHRSGTSALAGVLGLRGATLPKTQIPANSRNPRGFFESEVIYALHDELLSEAGTGWDDLSPLPAGWVDSPSGEAWTQRLIEATREEYGEARLLLLKDPRMCRLVPLWKRVLAAIGTEPRFVLPIRNPLECAASLSGSYGISTSVGLLLWLDYFLCAERDTRTDPRCFLTYEALLADSKQVLSKIEQQLSLNLPRTSRSADAEIDEFLQRDLRRKIVGEGEIFDRPDVHPWVTEAYGWALRAAGPGRKPSAAELDKLRAQLVQAESAYGPALAASEVSRRRGVEALEAQLAEQAEENYETTRMLMRWLVDRVRDGDRPIPESLKAVVAALDEAPPAEIPGVASTGLLIGELHMQIQELEGERAERAEQLAALAKRLDRAEQDLTVSERRHEVTVRELDARQNEVERLREALSDQRDELRALRGTAFRQAAAALPQAKKKPRGNGDAVKAPTPEEH